MRPWKTSLWIVVALALAPGCRAVGLGGDKGSADEDDGDSKKKKVKEDDAAKATATPTAQPPVAAGTGVAQPPTDAPPVVAGSAPPPLPAPAPGGRSAVPTLEEWNAVTKEVAVTHSSKLNCETKMVREWLRVSCRGKNHTGGTPTGVTVTKGGGRGDDFAFTGPDVASLVVRFVEGVDLDAQFTWTDRSHKLRVWWPRGAPEPPAKAAFEGV